LVKERLTNEKRKEELKDANIRRDIERIKSRVEAFEKGIT